MNIINENMISLDLSLADKEAVIRHMAGLISKENRLDDLDEYITEVLHREALTSTGIGFGLAIPHGKCSAVKTPAVAFACLKDGIDWLSLDNTPVKVVFLLAVPAEADSNLHLVLLAALSRKFMDEVFRQQLLKVKSKQEILHLLNDVFDRIPKNKV